MGIFGKVAIAVALVLPMTAYVVGTLVAGDAQPARHDPIVMQAPATADDTGGDRNDPGSSGSDRDPAEPEVIRPNVERRDFQGTDDPDDDWDDDDDTRDDTRDDTDDSDDGDDDD